MPQHRLQWVYPSCAFGIAHILSFLIIALIASPQALAETGRWADSEQVSVRLISSTDAVGEASSLSLGLEFQMQEGWKIYWRSPGDAGFPPRPDWSASENVADVAMQWPAPMRFSLFGMQTVGYEDRVIFPLTVTPESPGQPIRLAAAIDFLVCDDEICVPGAADVALSLDAGAATLARSGHALERFTARVPVPGPVSGLAVSAASIAEAGPNNALHFDLAVTADDPLSEIDAFIEGPVDLYLEAPVITYSDDRRQAVLRYEGGGLPAKALIGETVTITAVTLGDGDTRFLETQFDVGADPIGDLNKPDPRLSSSVSALTAMIGIALLGGLILNLMPCVLPVLSLKVLKAAQSGGMDRRVARVNFLASAFGVVFCFLLIAAGLIALKSTGAAIGWGIQFQNGPFLAFMILVLLLFAGNLAGAFDIQLPSALSTRLAGFGAQAGHTGMSEEPGQQQATPGAHFTTGAFAALLATPCSAPFLGTAVGFALSRGAAEILIIFLALGLGLAAPYVLLALAPRLVTALPKPGAWMLKLKWVLALALVGTAIWLWSVLQTVAGMQTAIGVFALSALAVAVIAARKLPGSRLGRFGPALAVGVSLAAILAPVLNSDHVPKPLQTGADQVEYGVHWVAFDPAAIERFRQAGKVVFVDVTADWCITCKFNKKTVLEDGDVAPLLAADGVIAMQADWTRPNPEITAFLAKYDRYGIPFNLVYGPGVPEGLALSELLTVASVTDAIHKAAEGSSVAASLAALGAR